MSFYSYQNVIVQVFIISFYNKIFLFTMEAAKVNQSLHAQLRGPNFHGTVELKADVLFLNVTEFKKGAIYTFETNNFALQKEFKRFLIFRKTEELFEELSSNCGIYISDENTLILPISVEYKGRSFDLSIEIPLIIRKFNNQAEKMQYLFEQIDKLSQEKLQIIKAQVPQLISFKGDETNQKFKSFEFFDNKKKLRMLATNTHLTINHSEPLGKGAYFFKVKILKTAAKHLMIGVCGNEIKSTVNGYNSPYYLGLYLYNGFLYGNGKNPCVASGFTIVEGESVIKVEIHMKKKLIVWLLNQTYLYAGQMPKELCNINIYPMINFYSNGDTVELLDR